MQFFFNAIFTLIFSYFLSIHANALQATNPPSIILDAYQSHKDFSRTYWLDKFTADKPSFVLESNFFYAEFSTKKLCLDRLAERNGKLVDSNKNGPAIPFKIFKQYQGINYELKSFDDKKQMANCDLVESGRYFQRRTIRELIWNQLPPESNDYLQISAWPNSLNFSADFQNCQNIEWQLDLKNYSKIKLKDETIIEIQDHTEKSFVISVLKGRLHLDEKTLKIRAQGNNINFKITPSTARLTEPNKSFITVAAKQEKPRDQQVPVTFDQELNAHIIDIEHINIAKTTEARNKREEIIAFQITNHSQQGRMARIIFQKSSKGTGPITGVSAVILNKAGIPTGKHIQISKNWHQGKTHKFQGQWIRKFTQINVPAGQTVELKYLSVNALWKGLPAASHNQLALPGYKGHRNHLWEQSALGAWGESICYDPENGLSASITDVRPLMVTSMSKNQTKWNWTNNVGGGEFLSIYKAGSTKRLSSIQVQTNYLRNCPVLTEVNYSALTEDKSASISYTTSISRSDDLVRGIYNVEYKILKDINFDRLVLFQIGADCYNYANENAFAIGNGAKVDTYWSASPGGNKYKGRAHKLAKKNSWVALYKSSPQPYGAAATRGIVIRDWHAQIQGQENEPYVQERGIELGRRMRSIADICLAPNIKTLKAGDTIKACFEMIISPQYVNDYYGPNQALKTSLNENENSWRSIAREAGENSLNIKVQSGKILRNRPLLIATHNNSAEFTVDHGLAFQPVTFTGINENHKGKLELKTTQGWQKCSQSDFYQADYNVKTKCWEYTFSMPLDDAESHQFRFSLQE